MQNTHLAYFCILQNTETAPLAKDNSVKPKGKLETRRVRGLFSIKILSFSCQELTRVGGSIPMSVLYGRYLMDRIDFTALNK